MILISYHNFNIYIIEIIQAHSSLGLVCYWNWSQRPRKWAEYQIIIFVSVRFHQREYRWLFSLIFWILWATIQAFRVQTDKFSFLKEFYQILCIILLLIYILAFRLVALFVSFVVRATISFRFVAFLILIVNDNIPLTAIDTTISTCANVLLRKELLHLSAGFILFGVLSSSS